mmetsp:Transcript_15704/g.61341  ORF Transcript_15704/g.61341 Transcript_15704/m.61341 type:complete len:305 (+) Transcript_15704:383-1297(+)
MNAAVSTESMNRRVSADVGLLLMAEASEWRTDITTKGSPLMPLLYFKLSAGLVESSSNPLSAMPSVGTSSAAAPRMWSGWLSSRAASAKAATALKYSASPATKDKLSTEFSMEIQSGTTIGKARGSSGILWSTTMPRSCVSSFAPSGATPLTHSFSATPAEGLHLAMSSIRISTAFIWSKLPTCVSFSSVDSDRAAAVSSPAQPLLANSSNTDVFPRASPSPATPVRRAITRLHLTAPEEVCLFRTASCRASVELGVKRRPPRRRSTAVAVVPRATSSGAQRMGRRVSTTRGILCTSLSKAARE